MPLHDKAPRGSATRQAAQAPRAAAASASGDDSCTASEGSTEVGSEEGATSDGEEEGDADPAAPRFAHEQTLVIMDWDDTLLPTTWLEAQGLRLAHGAEPSEAQQEQLHLMATWAAQTLTVAKSYGHVLIVTNAEEGWVEKSCRQFLPSLLAELEDVRILSARSCYERRGVARPSAWKWLAFRSEIETFFASPSRAGQWKNVLSIGDSPHERQALIRVTDQVEKVWAKAVKLVERPAAQEFLKEHQVLCQCLGDIANHEGSLDMSFD